MVKKWRSKETQEDVLIVPNDKENVDMLENVDCRPDVPKQDSRDAVCEGRGNDQGIDLSQVPRSRCKAAVSQLNGFLYVHGGRDGNIPLKDLWRLHIASGQWERVCWTGDNLLYLQEHTMVAHESNLYIFGGNFQFGGELDTPLWILDTATWVCRKPSACLSPLRRSGYGTAGLPMSRRGHTAVKYRKSMYVYGGYIDMRGSTDQLWAFHFESEEWNLLDGWTMAGGEPPMVGRHGHSAVVHESYMWVYGGQSGLAPLSDLCRYNLDRGIWKRVYLSHSPPALEGHTACVVGNVMYIYGGIHQGEPLNQLWAFHFVFNRWSRISQDSESVPRPCLAYHSVAVVMTHRGSPLYRHSSAPNRLEGRGAQRNPPRSRAAIASYPPTRVIRGGRVAQRFSDVIELTLFDIHRSAKVQPESVTAETSVTSAINSEPSDSALVSVKDSKSLLSISTELPSRSKIKPHSDFTGDKSGSHKEGIANEIFEETSPPEGLVYHVEGCTDGEVMVRDSRLHGGMVGSRRNTVVTASQTLSVRTDSLSSCPSGDDVPLVRSEVAKHSMSAVNWLCMDNPVYSSVGDVSQDHDLHFDSNVGQGHSIPTTGECQSVNKQDIRFLNEELALGLDIKENIVDQYHCIEESNIGQGHTNDVFVDFNENSSHCDVKVQKAMGENRAEGIRTIHVMEMEGTSEAVSGCSNDRKNQQMEAKDTPDGLKVRTSKKDQTDDLAFEFGCRNKRKKSNVNRERTGVDIEAANVVRVLNTPTPVSPTKGFSSGSDSEARREMWFEMKELSSRKSPTSSACVTCGSSVTVNNHCSSTRKPSVQHAYSNRTFNQEDETMDELNEARNDVTKCKHCRGEAEVGRAEPGADVGGATEAWATPEHRRSRGVSDEIEEDTNMDAEEDINVHSQDVATKIAGEHERSCFSSPMPSSAVMYIIGGRARNERPNLELCRLTMERIFLNSAQDDVTV